MSRLIDADATKRRVADTFFDTLIPCVNRALDDSPTIDAVPVIRCRECKQGEIDDPDFPDEYYCHAGCGWNKGDFYCAYGERKEGAD